MVKSKLSDGAGGDKGKSVPVPPLTLGTEIQKKRFHEAEIRKQMRLEAAREMEEAVHYRPARR